MPVSRFVFGNFFSAADGHALPSSCLRVFCNSKNRSAKQEDYLETLTQLIEACEAQHAPVKDASGLEVLRYLMEQHGLAVADPGKILGKDSSLACKILSGDRQITADHARSLARHFNVSAAVFVG